MYIAGGLGGWRHWVQAFEHGARSRLLSGQELLALASEGYRCNRHNLARCEVCDSSGL